MRLNYITQGDIIVYYPEGRMDLANSLKTEAKLNEKLQEGFLKMVFDLENLECLSSSGLRVFIALVRKMKEKNGRVVFCSLSSGVQNVIKMTQLDDVFEIHKTRSEALDSF
ncbi:MAG: STAS domain-containing protein [Syntrophaceae bacterium]